MNDISSFEINEDLGISSCSLIKDYFPRFRSGSCSDCPVFVDLNNYYSLDFEEGDEPF